MFNILAAARHSGHCRTIIRYLQIEPAIKSWSVFYLRTERRKPFIFAFSLFAEGRTQNFFLIPSKTEERLRRNSERTKIPRKSRVCNRTQRKQKRSGRKLASAAGRWRRSGTARRGHKHKLQLFCFHARHTCHTSLRRMIMSEPRRVSATRSRRRRCLICKLVNDFASEINLPTNEI